MGWTSVIIHVYLHTESRKKLEVAKSCLTCSSPQLCEDVFKIAGFRCCLIMFIESIVFCMNATFGEGPIHYSGFNFTKWQILADRTLFVLSSFLLLDVVGKRNLKKISPCAWYLPADVQCQDEVVRVIIVGWTAETHMTQSGIQWEDCISPLWWTRS